MDFLYGRTIKEGDLVRCYVNLHQQGKYSIVNMKTGLVVGYATSVLLQDAVFHVSEAGRLQVIEQKRKKVHAWVKGVFLGSNVQPQDMDIEVNYNPYIDHGFTDIGGNIITYANFAYLANKRVYIKNTPL